MAGNINNFISSFGSTQELSRPCNYYVDITPPTEFFTYLNQMKVTSDKLRNIWGELNDANDIKNLSRFRCEQTELPPRAFTLVQQKTYGPLEFYPIQNIYNKTAMTFICQDNMKEKLFFDIWMEMICSTHPDFNYSNFVNPFSTGANPPRGMVRFDFNYKNAYTSDIIIRQNSLKGSPSYSVALRDAFPTEVYSMPLSWAQQNDYHRINVVFTYRYHYTLEYQQGGQD